MQSQLKTWKERIKTNFHSQYVSYDMYCKAPAVLQVESVYKQGKNFIFRYMLKSVNTMIQQTSNVDDDKGFFCGRMNRCFVNLS